MRPFRYDPRVRLEPGDVREVREDRRLPPDVRRKPWQRVPVLPPGVTMPGTPALPGLPPHVYPPINAYHIDLPLNRVPVAIPAGGAAVTDWPAIPLGAYGVVRQIGLSSSDFANTRTTTFINDAPVQPYPGVTGAIGEIEEPQQTVVILKPGDLFRLQVENLSGVGPITVATRTVGWWWW